MRGVEVICNLGGWSRGGSNRDADPIVVAQRLRGAQNRAAGSSEPRCAAPPSDPAGPAAPLEEAAGGAPGTCPVQLQVDVGVAVLLSLGGSAGPVFLLSAPRDSSHLLEWRQLGDSAKPKGQRRVAEPAMVVADPLRPADGSRGSGGG